MYIVAGLGNPGEKYRNTRHNAGFWVIDRLADEMGVKVNRLKFKSFVGDGILCGKKVILLKPQTYMNLSGEAIMDARDYYKVPNDNIIVVYDDVALPAGRLRIRTKGSDGGHNGIKSILYMLQSDEFLRIRVGVGMPENKNYDLADWVMSSIQKDEENIFENAVKRACDASKLIISGDIQAAMSQYNRALPDKPDENEKEHQNKKE